MSGRRFVIRAAKLGIPVAIVNQGPTRGDGHATVTVDAPLGELLPALADRVTGPGRTGAAAVPGPGRAGRGVAGGGTTSARDTGAGSVDHAGTTHAGETARAAPGRRRRGKSSPEPLRQKDLVGRRCGALLRRDYEGEADPSTSPPGAQRHDR